LGKIFLILLEKAIFDDLKITLIPSVIFDGLKQTVIFDYLIITAIRPGSAL